MPLLTQMLPQFVPMLRDSINTRLKQKNVGGGIKLGKKNMKRPGVQELAPCRIPRAAAAAATVAGLAWLGSGSQHPPSYSPYPPPRRPFYYLRFVRPGRTHPRTEFGRRLQAEMIEPDEFLSEMTVRPSAASNPARGHPSSSGPALT